ncbi:MAG: DUF488 domain-containing protein [Coriobacteriales bacterium]|nr:DUF488 domain-containing protein [Coriobacteriaceae bacterium]MDY5662410.1 DUF488 domain-containing protein [Coriobacteriales bacterium]
MNIQIKRVYDAPEESDGTRILVDRLWPRGIKKETLQLDDWAKVLAPSTEARKAFAHKAENFGEFKGRYEAELDQSAEAHEYVSTLAASNPPVVTLLYAAKDPQVNHAIVLKGWLERQVGDAESCD